MENNEVRKSLFVRIFEVIIALILKFRILVLIFIAVMTVFFAKALFSLHVDANIFGFSSIAPPAEYVTTPETPQKESLLSTPFLKGLLNSHQNNTAIQKGRKQKNSMPRFHPA